MMNPFLWLNLTVIDLYFYVILAMVIMSWLVAFNIINASNPYVRQIGYALRRLTEPLLGPIRRFLPDLGGIDISPIVLLIALQFVRYFVGLLRFAPAVTPALRAGRGGLLLAVRVTPKASCNAVTGLHAAADGAMSLAVKVTAPPDKGKANRAVIEVIAKAAGLPKSSFRIVSGETERHKTLLVAGNAAELAAWIAGLKDEG